MEGDFLSHHGIKGQKWGIRRYQNPDGTLTEEGQKRYGSVENLDDDIERKAEKKWKKSDANKISDEELRKRIARLQNEATYKRLLTELNPPEIKAVKEKNPLFKQIFISTAVTALSSVIQTMYDHKLKDLIASRVTKTPEKLQAYREKVDKRNLVFPKKK